MKTDDLIKVGKIVDKARRLWQFDPNYLSEEDQKEYKLTSKKIYYLALLLDKMEKKGIIA